MPEVRGNSALAVFKRNRRWDIKRNIALIEPVQFSKGRKNTKRKILNGFGVLGLSFLTFLDHILGSILQNVVRDKAYGLSILGKLGTASEGEYTGLG